MTVDPTDLEIARRLEAERRDDEAAAPDLDALLSRAPRRRRPATAGRRVALGTAALVIVAGAAVVLRDAAGHRRHAPGAETLAAAGVELARWQAPTDALLATPGSDLRTELPELAASSGPEPEPPPAPTKGADR